VKVRGTLKKLTGTDSVVAEALEGVPFSTPELLTDTIETDATFASADQVHGRYRNKLS